MTDRNHRGRMSAKGVMRDLKGKGEGGSGSIDSRKKQRRKVYTTMGEWKGFGANSKGRKKRPRPRVRGADSGRP